MTCKEYYMLVKCGGSQGWSRVLTACTGSGKIVLKHEKVNLPGEIREPPQLFLKQLHLMIYGSGMPFLDVRER